jgi:hypothetical protein
MTNEQPISPSLRITLDRAAGDQTILWAAQDNPVTSFRRGFFVWLVGIPWSLVTAVGLFASSSGGPSWFDVIFFTPFVGVGALLLSAPALGWVAAKTTIYGASAKTFYVVYYPLKKWGNAYDVRDLKMVTCTEKADGTGFVKLVFRNHANADSPTSIDLPHDMPDARRVADFFEDLRRRAIDPTSGPPMGAFRIQAP